MSGMCTRLDGLLSYLFFFNLLRIKHCCLKKLIKNGTSSSYKYYLSVRDAKAQLNE